MALLFVWQPLTSQAGVTIHYEGTLKNSSSISNLITLARSFAKTNGWTIEEIHKKQVDEVRVIDEKEVKYSGPLDGVILYADEWCEPIELKVGSDLFFQSYVKTQFTKPETHIKIVRLLQQLQSQSKTLVVFDEGEFWESDDAAKLKGHMDNVNSMLKAIKGKNASARGPVKLKSGRIVDVIQ